MTIGTYYLGVILVLILVLINVIPYIFGYHLIKYVSNKISLKKYPDLSENSRSMKMFNFRYWGTVLVYVLIFCFITLPTIIFL